MEEVLNFKQKEFGRFVEEFMTSYEACIREPKGSLSDEDMSERIKKDLSVKFPELDDNFWRELNLEITHLTHFEQMLKQAEKSGCDRSDWLYDMLRPRIDRDIRSNEYLTYCHNLRQIHQNVLSMQNALANTMPQINTLERQMNLNAIGQFKPGSADYQKLVMSHYQRTLKLDIAYDMTEEDMSICAMDDVAYSLTKNAALMLQFRPLVQVK